MTSTRTFIAGLAAGVTLAIVAAATAQPFGGDAGGFGPGMGRGAGHGPMATADRTAFMAARLDDLKARLGITTAQDPAWQAFATQAKQNMEAMDGLRTQMWNRTGSAPERMAQHNAFMQQRLAAMSAQTSAFQALYAVLTPEQKAIADQSMGMMGPHGMRRGPRAG